MSKFIHIGDYVFRKDFVAKACITNENRLRLLLSDGTMVETLFVAKCSARVFLRKLVECLNDDKCDFMPEEW
jgi:hypothetical protein